MLMMEMELDRESPGLFHKNSHFVILLVEKVIEGI